jgi:hypothetical protein
VRLKEYTQIGNKIMPTGILPDTLRKSIFVLGVMMMTLAGAMERMDGDAQIDVNQCAMHVEVEMGNHG